MKVTTASFLCAAEEEKDYPKKGFKEIAFAGRSNVGKSSLISTLLGRRGLVRTSKTPGQTKRLNFFLINDRLIFVDLPGYGFAAVPQEVKKKWGPMVRTYLTVRKELAGVVVIVDSRMLPTETDMQLLQFLQHSCIPVVVAATKSDKVTRSRAIASERAIKGLLGDRIPVVIFSSHDGHGKNELWKEIKNLIE